MSRVALKILLAEDDPNISTIARLALEQVGGHQVLLAEDGAQALEFALSQDFDVILLDEMMPKLNGLKVCQEYQARKANPAPIIFLSAKSQDSDIEEFKSMALGFIPKPFDPMELAKRVENLLQTPGARAA